VAEAQYNNDSGDITGNRYNGTVFSPLLASHSATTMPR
jgi:hypothetical protein